MNLKKNTFYTFKFRIYIPEYEYIYIYIYIYSLLTSYTALLSAEIRFPVNTIIVLEDFANSYCSRCQGVYNSMASAIYYDGVLLY